MVSGAKGEAVGAAGVVGVPQLRCVSRRHPCPPGGAGGTHMGCNLLTQA